MARVRLTLAALASLGATLPAAAQDAPSLETLWEVIQQQQREIDELKRQVDSAQAQIAGADESIEATQEMVVATADYVETLEIPAAGRSDTTIGGYGELHYTQLDAEITEDWITKWNYDPVSYFGIDFASSIDPTNELLEVNLQGNELAVSPNYSLRMTVEHAFFSGGQKSAVIPWVTLFWEDDSYLTIWNVEKHTDEMDFVILDEDIKYTDDKRNSWGMLHAGVRWHVDDLTMEIYGYNITNEVVQYWGGAAEQVAKGSFSMPRTYGIRIGYDF